MLDARFSILDMNSGSILYHWNVHEYEIFSKCRYSGTNGISEINEPNDTGSYKK